MMNTLRFNSRRNASFSNVLSMSFAQPRIDPLVLRHMEVPKDHLRYDSYVNLGADNIQRRNTCTVIHIHLDRIQLLRKCILQPKETTRLRTYTIDASLQNA